MFVFDLFCKAFASAADNTKVLKYVLRMQGTIENCKKEIK